MEAGILSLSIMAASVGFFHTLTGPDHYVPFIMISRARNWSYMKTVVITVLCGIGHVGSSIVLGLIGIAAGIGVSKLESVESHRGVIASWIIIAFGFAYLIWGLYHARKNHHHHHALDHNHSHDASDEHGNTKKKNITPWVLFIIFVFGPCEPLIPLFIYPAAQHSVLGVAAVSIVFSVVTLLTMITIVTLSYKGLKLIKFPFFEKYTHAIAGATIMICGLGIVFLGL